MQDQSDIQLLRAYADSGSDAAFRELVTRHTDFVFSAALRQVESPDLAADLAQSVFTDLARKARPVAEKLPSASSLAGWLHRSTRYAVLNHLRDTRRRQSNERQAMEQLLTDTGSVPDWEHIRPTLDEALDSLADEDREALLLRYFKNQDYRAIGLAIGTSDDTAQKRVTRAVDRLRDYFSQRNVTIGASGLVVLISANALQAAPAGLVTAITTTALAGATVTTSTLIAATKTIAMTTLQKTLVTAALTVIMGGGIYEAHQSAQLRAQNGSLKQQLAPLTTRLRQLQSERDAAAGQVVSLRDEIARTKSNEQELLKLRNENTMLRTRSATGTAADNIAAPVEIVQNTGPSPEDVGRELGQAVVRGDMGAFDKLLAESKNAHQSFNTNSPGLSDTERDKLSRRAFATINAAFDEIAEAAAAGSQPALDAVIRSIQVPELKSLATESLGMLAMKGNDPALEMLVTPEKYGLLLSSSVEALKGAASVGNQKAINALAAVAADDTQAPLWLITANSLSKAAEFGNSVAIDALIGMSSSTNQNIQNAVIPPLKSAAANQNTKAAAALRALGIP